jgi:hypothetical protein
MDCVADCPSVSLTDALHPASMSFFQVKLLHKLMEYNTPIEGLDGLPSKNLVLQVATKLSSEGMPRQPEI